MSRSDETEAARYRIRRQAQAAAEAQWGEAWPVMRSPLALVVSGRKRRAREARDLWGEESYVTRLVERESPRYR